MDSHRLKVIFITRSPFYQYLGIMTLAAVIKPLPVERVLCLAREEDVEREITRAVCPVVLAYSVMSYDSDFFLEFNKRIKRKYSHVITIWGGSHATFVPEVVNEEGIDVICRGEGEEAFKEFCIALIKGEPIASIANLWCKTDGVVSRNELRPLEQNLDTIPFPDRAFFHSLALEEVVLQVMANRGCPFKCTFCYNQTLRQLYADQPGAFVRMRSPQQVINEILQAKREIPFGIKRILFLDSILNISKPWLREFMELYSRSVKIPFSCGVRADIVDEETVALLKKGGCRRVAVGVEVGDEAYRKTGLHKNVSDAQLRTTMNLLRKYGIKSKTLNMLGLPGKGLAEDMKTLQLNIELKPTIASVCLFIPPPGTVLYEELKKDGLLKVAYGFSDNYGIVKNKVMVKLCNENEEHDVENLNAIFSLWAKFPFLSPVFRVLIKLPFRDFIFFVGKMYMFFVYTMVLDEVNMPQLLRRHSFAKLVRRFFKQMREF